MGRLPTPSARPIRVRRTRRLSDPLHILFVVSEVSPFAKTGGLADVAAALPAAIARLGHEVTVVMPRYRGIQVSGEPRRVRIRLGAFDHDVDFHETPMGTRHRLVTVDVPSLYNRDGYYGEGGQDYADNHERFGIFAAASLEYATRSEVATPVNVIHAHDWQAGLVPALARIDPPKYPAFVRSGVVMTIHNLTYQGRFPRDVVPLLGLPWSAYGMDRGEFWGDFSFLKAGIAYSDMITTVSPTYARETQQASHGVGLEGVLSLRANRYVGILNGIDVEAWNPETDPNLPANYSATALAGKRTCKRALLAHFRLPVGDDALGRPVIAMVSRLADQKGFDLLLSAADRLLKLDATWVFLGQGDARIEAFLRDLQRLHPSRVAAHIGFNQPLAHLITAGADIFLMPSHFEPCGLGQMYALRYGTVPVVSPVGGLQDTVQPYTNRAKHPNGFKLREITAEALVRVLRQATRLYHDRSVWLPLVRQGMAADRSWDTAAGEYVKVYRQARDIAAIRGGL